jgi:hypothetical protein
MDSITNNLSTIAAGAVVFGILGLALFRLIRRLRRGESACGCGGCAGCAGSGRAAGPLPPVRHPDAVEN